MAILLDNKILEAAEQKIEASLLPAVLQPYQQIVVAGMRLAMHGGPNSIVAKLKQSQDPLKSCAEGAVNIVMLLEKQARGTMPKNAMIPAAMTLMLQALDFADKTGVLKVGVPELVKATHIFTNHLFKAFRITPQMLHTAAAKVHGVMQDPTKMELISRRAGVVKDPRASQPTEAPVEEPNGV